MAIKLLILVVVMGAIACAVNGRVFKNAADELDDQKTFFHKPFHPYFKGKEGWFGGFGSGIKPGFKGWKKGWFGGKPVSEKPMDGNVNAGFGNGTSNGNGGNSGGDSGGNVGTGGAIGSLENASGLRSGEESADGKKVVGRGAKHHGKP